MFGLNALFNALARLTSAITHSAELFEAANTHLEQQLGYQPSEASAAPALPDARDSRDSQANVHANGRAAKAKARV